MVSKNRLHGKVLELVDKNVKLKAKNKAYRQILSDIEGVLGHENFQEVIRLGKGGKSA